MSNYQIGDKVISSGGYAPVVGTIIDCEPIWGYRIEWETNPPCRASYTPLEMEMHMKVIKVLPKLNKVHFRLSFDLHRVP